MKRSPRFAVIVFATFLCMTCAGCLYLPGFGACESETKDFRAYVGQANSQKPIRPGNATLTAVSAALGKPDRLSQDNRIAAYRYTTIKGYRVALLYHFNATYFRDYFLYLRFDGSGELTHLRMLANPYFDNNVYQIDIELLRFEQETE